MAFHCEFVKKHKRAAAVLTATIGVVALSLTLALTHVLSKPARAQDVGGAVGQRARDFALERFKGHMTRLSDFEGQAVLLDLWTSWDPTSREDLSALEATFQKYREKGFTVIAVHRTRSELKKIAEDFVKANAFTFPVLFDATGGVHDMYSDGSNVTPVKVLIDRKGVVLEKAFGRQTVPQDAIERALH